MPTRHRTLLLILALGFLALVALGAFSPSCSIADVLTMLVFAIVFLLLAFFLLLSRGSQSAEGHRGLPRIFWVVFSSLAAAFSTALLGALIALPWQGYAGFDLLFGDASNGWVLLILAAIFYPFIQRKLL